MNNNGRFRFLVAMAALGVVFAGCVAAPEPALPSAPTTTDGPWARTFGGTGTDEFTAVALAADGGLILVGGTDSPDGDFPPVQSEADAVLAKISPTGEASWAGTFGGTGADRLVAVAVTPDGGIVAVGSTNSPDGDFPATHGEKNSDAVVVAFAADGTPDWAWTLGGSGYDEFAAVAVRPDGTLVVAGRTSSKDGDFPITHGGDSFDAVVAELRPGGEIVWAKTYGGSGMDVFNAVALADDGGVVVAGTSASSDGDFPLPDGRRGAGGVVARLGAAGELEWKYQFGGAGSDSLNAVAVVGDAILVGGSVRSVGTAVASKHSDSADGVVIRLAADGTQTWASVVGGSGTDEILALAAVADTVVAVGYTDSEDGDFPVRPGNQVDALVVKIAADGTPSWGKAYGGTGDDSLAGAAPSGGQVVAVGESGSADGSFPRSHSGGSDALIVRPDAG